MSALLFSCLPVLALVALSSVCGFFVGIALSGLSILLRGSLVKTKQYNP